MSIQELVQPSVVRTSGFDTTEEEEREDDDDDDNLKCEHISPFSCLISLYSTRILPPELTTCCILIYYAHTFPVLLCLSSCKCHLEMKEGSRRRRRTGKKIRTEILFAIRRKDRERQRH